MGQADKPYRASVSLSWVIMWSLEIPKEPTVHTLTVTAFNIKSSFPSEALKGPVCHPTSPPAQLTQPPGRTSESPSKQSLLTYTFTLLAWRASPSLVCGLNSYPPFMPLMPPPPRSLPWTLQEERQLLSLSCLFGPLWQFDYNKITPYASVTCSSDKRKEKIQKNKKRERN